MTSEVFQNDDLRRYILSYLRHEPLIKCTECECVCVWDRKVKPYFVLNLYRNICMNVGTLIITVLGVKFLKIF